MDNFLKKISVSQQFYEKMSNFINEDRNLSKKKIGHNLLTPVRKLCWKIEVMWRERGRPVHRW